MVCQRARSERQPELVRSRKGRHHAAVALLRLATEARRRFAKARRAIDRILVAVPSLETFVEKWIVFPPRRPRASAAILRYEFDGPGLRRHIEELYLEEEIEAVRHGTWEEALRSEPADWTSPDGRAAPQPRLHSRGECITITGARATKLYMARLSGNGGAKSEPLRIVLDNRGAEKRTPADIMEVSKPLLGDGLAQAVLEPGEA